MDPDSKPAGSMRQMGFVPRGMYKHEPLDMAKSQIRLLRIPKDKLWRNVLSSQPIYCDITTFDLRTAPEYIALSYVWGSPYSKSFVYVNG